MIKPVYPENGAEISFLTPAFREFIRRQKAGLMDLHPDDESVNDWIPEGEENSFYNKAKANLSHPAVLYFRWECDDPARLMDLEISEDADFSAPSHVTAGRIFAMAGERTFCCPVTNFRGGKRYFWRVVADDGSRSEVRCFTTPADEVRPLFIDGCSNVRDIGGRRTEDGRAVRQGMIYRGVELEDDEVRDHRLTDRGRRTFISELGIRTDLDLREEAGGRVVRTGDWGDVRYVLRPCESWGRTLSGEWAQRMRDVMEVLLDPANYPLYFHCYAGADRTGTVGTYLDCLLGLPKEVIKFNFSVTSLSCFDKRNWTLHGYREEFLADLDRMYPEAGGVRSEMIKAHLLAIGIKKKMIDGFLDFMLE